jgi:hypothetical protein
MNSEMLSPGNLLAGVIFGLLGLFLFRAAKRDANLPAIAFSLGLMGYSWFVTNVWANWGIGILLSFFAFRSLRN